MSDLDKIHAEEMEKLELPIEEQEQEEQETPIDQPVIEEEKPAPKENTPETPEEKPAFTVKIKDFDGKVHEFASEDDIPEDFEPASYAELAKASVEFAKHSIKAEAEAEKQKLDAEQVEKKRVSDELNAKWDSEAEQLIKDGLLKESEKNDVFNYMVKKANENTAIDSFAIAFHALKHEQAIADATKQKKEAGAKIMGAGASSSPTSKDTGYRHGMTLDQVHSQFVDLK